MVTIFGRNKAISWILSSVQLKYAFSYLVLILGLLLLLNTYSLLVSRDLVFAAKENAMRVTANNVSQVLSHTDLNYSMVSRAIGALELQTIERIIVREADGRVIYDSAQGAEALETLAAYPALQRAQMGYHSFHSAYENAAFYSWVASPIYAGRNLVGTVYLHERDETQGAFMLGIGRNLTNISIIIFLVSLLLSVIVSRALTARLTAMLSAMRQVGQGDYSYRLAVRGSDELAELGDAFNKLTHRLHETEEMRRRFVSDASHELKTPLASIQLLSDSIVQSADMKEEIIREFVEDIGQEARRLTRITEKLLALTRLDALRQVDLNLVDLKSVITQAGQMLIPLADEFDVSLTFSLENACEVSGTEDDMHQIIFNLAENAIKYNKEGGSVFIALRKNENSVVLEVTDSGIGIPEEDLPYVFERFYRVDKARTRDKGGSGLGLSIVHDTADQHGGTVAITSSDDGTSVRVTFPLYQAEEEGHDAI